MASETTERTGTVSRPDAIERAIVKCLCPACGEATRATTIERCGKYELLGCEQCGLQYWQPRQMPDAHWYEQMYDGRDQAVLPLEPGHEFFLADALAPRAGELLDIGCGTGNFLAAARDAGYGVTGIELDRKAARFAQKRLRLERVLPLSIAEFVEKFVDKRFDVVTSFEVLEHQAEPMEFLRLVKACLKPRGTIALSVPNRERWMTGPDVLDYPPNHFLRWNAEALRRFLDAQGFEVLSVREQPAGVKYTAQMLNVALGTGIVRHACGMAWTSFRELMQMPPEQAKATQLAKSTALQRFFLALGRVKYAACYPLALAAFPYVRMRRYKGTYLYCLARLRG